VLAIPDTTRQADDQSNAWPEDRAVAVMPPSANLVSGSPPAAMSGAAPIDSRFPHIQ
jgi:hypothetical protein